MSLSLVPEITTAGLQAVWNATRTGMQAEITHIALGDASYTPSKAQTALQSERRRVPVAGGSLAGPQQIHVTGLEAGSLSYWVREVGFFLGDGTLLAVWSSPAGPLAYKAAGVDLVVAFDLSLSALPANAITVSTTGTLNLFVAGELARLSAAQLAAMERETRLLLLVQSLAGRIKQLELSVTGLRAQLRR